MSHNVKIFFILVALLLPLSSRSQSYLVRHLGGEVNSKGSESAPLVMGDSLLLYASHDYQHGALMRLCLARMDSSHLPTSSVGVPDALSSRQFHIGNAAYDPVDDVLFFTRCAPDDDDEIVCEILYSRRRKGRWSLPLPLGGDVNLKGYTSTQPTIDHLTDGSTILYFVSDRPGGLGGLDIWYTLLRNFKPSPSANLGHPVNSPADELTPFYFQPSKTLYFSSDRSGTLGGYDIFFSSGTRDAWSLPQHLPAPLNSEYNDLYFTVPDTSVSWGFFASNRADSFFATDSSCCNDLYLWQRSTLTPQTVSSNKLPTDTLVKGQLSKVKPQVKSQAKSLFPIRLYFHNDEPDPHSQSDTSLLTYFQTYNRYMFLRNTYKDVWQGLPCYDSLAGEADDFFFDEVAANCDRFELLLDFIYDDLTAGRKVALTVSGYASPLHTSAYNDKISRRRIATIVNQIAQWRNGALRRYVDQGCLQIRQQPWGSSMAPESRPPKCVSDSQKYAVYGIPAARERRIEILDYDYFK